MAGSLRLSDNQFRIAGVPCTPYTPLRCTSKLSEVRASQTDRRRDRQMQFKTLPCLIRH